ncbi:MAG: polysaccharide biosynthesis/export family protein [Phycisphaeraceae bacterium]|nr:polysaccharide biosynthesis/export family protein [Phycisphaeraceae bacterium]MCB9848719.1 polysaccharide biosynthesis/export family protein [Phycisphaeraceae bacterium]
MTSQDRATGDRNPGYRRSLTRAGAYALLAGSIAGAMTGCSVDSWFDPSVVGRWEHTPTVVPILDRIDVIERDTGEFIETTEVSADDLIPEVSDYVIGAGDSLGLEIWDIIAPGVPSSYERQVSGNGMIEIPQVGKVQVIGLTPNQAQEAIADALREAQLVENALVTVIVTGQRQSTFSVFGQVPRVGRYLVPTSDYRLLEAVTEAGGLSPAIRYVYVIRQVPLSQKVRGGAGSETLEHIRPPETPNQNQPGETAPNLIDLIDQLTEPETESDEPSNGAFGMLDLTDDGLVAPGAFGGDSAPAPAAVNNVWAQLESDDPPIDLVDIDDKPTTTVPGLDLNADQDTGGWMFLNGEWVRITRRSVASQDSLPEGADPLAAAGEATEDLVTQRIIKIPVDPLLQGVAKYNIVIRPGDIIRVPGPEQGLVYLGGPGITRPGTYNLPIFGRLTLTKAIIASGGLSAIAIPSRVDLTRMVGEDRQATIRLNLAAIHAGTQPDIFLKPDDVINVGTTFWARPLAVVRNGFRATYGFGFLLDRNFGNDVFGAPPFSRQN